MVRLSDRQREVVFGLTLIGGVLLSLGIGEGVLRLWGEWQKSRTQNNSSFDWHEFRKATKHPVDEGEIKQFVPGTEYDHVRINSLGFRGPEVSDPKPPGTIRIAFLGDSMMLSAELLEEETISGRTLALLQSAFPACRFDYISVAGLEYTLRDLSKLLRDKVHPLEPDIYVLLAGTILTVLKERQERNPDGFQFYVEWKPHFLTHYSHLFARLPNMSHRLTERARANRINLRQELPDVEVADVFRDQILDLAKEIGQKPVVAIAYRTMLRSGQTTRKQALITRYLRHKTRGISPEEFIRLKSLLVKELKMTSRNLGWSFIDPVADFPGDRSHYINSRHFNSVGASKVGTAVANAVAPLVNARGRACLPTRVTQQPE